MGKIKLIAFICFANITTAQLSDFKNTDFTIPDNIAILNKDASLKRLPFLVHNLTHKLDTNVEKFRAIYTWVARNIKVDVAQYNTIMRKQKKFKNDSLNFVKWNKTYRKKYLNNLVNKKKTVCTGYAYLLSEMAKLAGIECKLINGYGRTSAHNLDEFEFVNHSWNAVKLNDKWYLCDPTWSSGHLNEEGKFINTYIDGYFLVEPKLFAKTHYPKDKKWLLTSYSSDDFITAPLVYNENFKYKIIPVLPNTLKVLVNKKQEIQFEFEVLNSIKVKDVSLISYKEQGDEYRYQIYDVILNNGVLKFKHRFKHRGIYDIHLKINEDVVVTYSVKVEK